MYAKIPATLGNDFDKFFHHLGVSGREELDEWGDYQRVNSLAWVNTALAI